VWPILFLYVAPAAAMNNLRLLNPPVQVSAGSPIFKRSVGGASIPDQTFASAMFNARQAWISRTPARRP
jgi:hypothetical protein